MKASLSPASSATCPPQLDNSWTSPDLTMASSSMTRKRAARSGTGAAAGVSEVALPGFGAPIVAADAVPSLPSPVRTGGAPAGAGADGDAEVDVDADVDAGADADVGAEGNEDRGDVADEDEGDAGSMPVVCSESSESSMRAATGSGALARWLEVRVASGRMTEKVDPRPGADRRIRR